LACRLADGILLDTDAHIDFFQKSFGIPREKFFRVYAGAETSLFHPGCVEKGEGEFQVLFVGKYTPLHGIEHIVEAAALLKDQKDLTFILIGKGQLYEPIRALAGGKHLTNIRFIEWAPYETLPEYIRRADLCLGIFAESAKADRVIPNKIFQAIAMGKPVVTGRTTAVESCLTHMENIFLCDPGDPAALAGAVMALKADPALRERMGAKALRTFAEELDDTAAIPVLEKALSMGGT
jgi:glycosyltransferase involved in cell wall biosynthesis